MKAITKLLILASMLLIASCGEIRTEETIQWIEKAKKPVRAYAHKVNGWNWNKTYTLIDSAGNVYNTGSVELSLPDTIK